MGLAIAAGSVLLIALAAGLAWVIARRGPRPAPDPEQGKPQDILAYVASPTFAAKTAEEKYTYIHQVLIAFNSYEGRRAFFEAVDALSDEQILRLRNNGLDAAKARMFVGAHEYAKLAGPEERVRCLDRSLDEMETFNAWSQTMARNPRVRRVIPKDYQQLFNLIMTRTTAAERSVLETYVTEAFMRHLERQVKGLYPKTPKPKKAEGKPS